MVLRSIWSIGMRDCSTSRVLQVRLIRVSKNILTEQANPVAIATRATIGAPRPLSSPRRGTNASGTPSPCLARPVRCVRGGREGARAGDHPFWDKASLRPCGFFASRDEADRDSCRAGRCGWRYSDDRRGSGALRCLCGRGGKVMWGTRWWWEWE